jgi:hydroxypyruvate isomerase
LAALIWSTSSNFMHDQGFTALEDNGLPERPVADQERIGQTIAEARDRDGSLCRDEGFPESDLWF